MKKWGDARNFFVDIFDFSNYNCFMRSDNKIDARRNKQECDIKARLAYNGYTQRALAKKMGVHFTLINKVVRGHRRTPRILNYIEGLPLTDRGDQNDRK